MDMEERARKRDAVLNKLSQRHEKRSKEIASTPKALKKIDLNATEITFFNKEAPAMTPQSVPTTAEGQFMMWDDKAEQQMRALAAWCNALLEVNETMKEVDLGQTKKDACRCIKNILSQPRKPDSTMNVDSSEEQQKKGFVLREYMKRHDTGQLREKCVNLLKATTIGASLETMLSKSVITVREECSVYSDLELQTSLLRLFLSFHPARLHLALETVYNEEIKLRDSESVTRQLSKFVINRVFSDPTLLKNKKFAQGSGKPVITPAGRLILHQHFLKRALLVLYVVESLMKAGIQPQIQRMFVRSSPFKCLDDIFAELSRDVLSGSSMSIKKLFAKIGFVPTYKQNFIDDYDYTVNDFGDLSNGIVLGRLVELVKELPTKSITGRMRNPNGDRIRKLKNVEIVLEEIVKDGSGSAVVDDVKASQIVAVHRESILAILWHLIGVHVEAINDGKILRRESLAILKRNSSFGIDGGVGQQVDSSDPESLVLNMCRQIGELMQREVPDLESLRDGQILSNAWSIYNKNSPPVHLYPGDTLFDKIVNAAEQELGISRAFSSSLALFVRIFLSRLVTMKRLNDAAVVIQRAFRRYCIRNIRNTKKTKRVAWKETAEMEQHVFAVPTSSARSTLDAGNGTFLVRGRARMSVTFDTSVSFMGASDTFSEFAGGRGFSSCVSSTPIRCSVSGSNETMTLRGASEDEHTLRGRPMFDTVVECDDDLDDDVDAQLNPTTTSSQLTDSFLEERTAMMEEIEMMKRESGGKLTLESPVQTQSKKDNRWTDFDDVEPEKRDDGCVVRAEEDVRSLPLDAMDDDQMEVDESSVESVSDVQAMLQREEEDEQRVKEQEARRRQAEEEAEMQRKQEEDEERARELQKAQKEEEQRRRQALLDEEEAQRELALEEERRRIAQQKIEEEVEKGRQAALIAEQERLRVIAMKEEEELRIIQRQIEEAEKENAAQESREGRGSLGAGRESTEGRFHEAVQSEKLGGVQYQIEETNVVLQSDASSDEQERLRMIAVAEEEEEARRLRVAEQEEQRRIQQEIEEEEEKAREVAWFAEQERLRQVAMEEEEQRRVRKEQRRIQQKVEEEEREENRRKKKEEEEERQKAAWEAEQTRLEPERRAAEEQLVHVAAVKIQAMVRGFLARKKFQRCPVENRDLLRCIEEEQEKLNRSVDEIATSESLEEEDVLSSNIFDLKHSPTMSVDLLREILRRKRALVARQTTLKNKILSWERMLNEQKASTNAEVSESAAFDTAFVESRSIDDDFDASPETDKTQNEGDDFGDVVAGRQRGGSESEVHEVAMTLDAETEGRISTRGGITFDVDISILDERIDEDEQEMAMEMAAHRAAFAKEDVAAPDDEYKGLRAVDLDPQIATLMIQRWWRGCRVRRALHDEVRRMQTAMDAYRARTAEQDGHLNMNELEAATSTSNAAAVDSPVGGRRRSNLVVRRNSFTAAKKLAQSADMLFHSSFTIATIAAYRIDRLTALMPELLVYFVAECKGLQRVLDKISHGNRGLASNKIVAILINVVERIALSRLPKVRALVEPLLVHLSPMLLHLMLSHRKDVGILKPTCDVLTHVARVYGQQKSHFHNPAFFIRQSKIGLRDQKSLQSIAALEKVVSTWLETTQAAKPPTKNVPDKEKKSDGRSKVQKPAISKKK